MLITARDTHEEEEEEEEGEKQFFKGRCSFSLVYFPC